MSQTVADIIEAKGGAAAFGKAIKTSAGRVRTWKSRGQLPRSSWPEIIATFPDLTLDRLKEVESGAK